MNEKRLPWNKKEGFLYGTVICTITVMVMLILNIGTTFGSLNGQVWIIILKALPVIWCIAMLLETMVVGKAAGACVSRFIGKTDGFNARILFNIMFVVLGMSLIMTLVGPLTSGESLKQIIGNYPAVWPRNFCVAFWCEICLAQPLARKVMKAIHEKKEQNNKMDATVLEG